MNEFVKITPAVKAGGNGVQPGVLIVPSAFSQKTHREVRAQFGSRDQATCALQGPSLLCGWPRNPPRASKPLYQTSTANIKTHGVFPRSQEERLLWTRSQTPWRAGLRRRVSSPGCTALGGWRTPARPAPSATARRAGCGAEQRGCGSPSGESGLCLPWKSHRQEHSKR